MSFINMSLFTGNYNSGYGPTNGGIYIAGPINIVASNSTFTGAGIINAQAGIGSSLPLTGYNASSFAEFTGCYVGLTLTRAIFSGYTVSFNGCNIPARITGMDSGGLPASFTFNSCTFGGQVWVNQTINNIVWNDCIMFSGTPTINAPI